MQNSLTQECVHRALSEAQHMLEEYITSNLTSSPQASTLEEAEQVDSEMHRLQGIFLFPTLKKKEVLLALTERALELQRSRSIGTAAFLTAYYTAFVKSASEKTRHLLSKIEQHLDATRLLMRRDAFISEAEHQHCGKCACGCVLGEEPLALYRSFLFSRAFLLLALDEDSRHAEIAACIEALKSELGMSWEFTGMKGSTLKTLADSTDVLVFSAATNREGAAECAGEGSRPDIEAIESNDRFLVCPLLKDFCPRGLTESEQNLCLLLARFVAQSEPDTGYKNEKIIAIARSVLRSENMYVPLMFSEALYLYGTNLERRLFLSHGLVEASLSTGPLPPGVRALSSPYTLALEKEKGLAITYVRLQMKKEACEIFSRHGMADEVAACLASLGRTEEAVQLLKERIRELEQAFRERALSASLAGLMSTPSGGAPEARKPTYKDVLDSAKMAECLGALGELEGREEHFLEAVRYNNTEKNVRRLALFYLKSERLDDAVNLLEKNSVALRDVPSLSVLGVSLLKAGRYAQAESTLEKAAVLDEKSYSVHKNLFVAQLAQKKLQKSIASLRRALDVSQTAQDFSSLFEVAFMASSYKNCMHALLGVYFLQKAVPAAWMKALVHVATKDHDFLEYFLEKTLAIDSGQIAPVINDLLSCTVASSGGHEGSLALPADSELTHRLRICRHFIAEGDYEEALKTLRTLRTLVSKMNGKREDELADCFAAFQQKFSFSSHCFT